MSVLQEIFDTMNERAKEFGVDHLPTEWPLLDWEFKEVLAELKDRAPNQQGGPISKNTNEVVLYFADCDLRIFRGP